MPAASGEPLLLLHDPRSLELRDFKDTVFAFLRIVSRFFDIFYGLMIIVCLFLRIGAP